MQANIKKPKPPPANYTPTYLEAPEEVSRALQAIRQGIKAPSGVNPAIREDAPPDDSLPFRPQLRPPIAVLGILDDGSREEGDWIRIRGDRLVLGRTEGDVRIPHDGLLSSKHAELVRERTSQGYRWSLVDLNSTNGTFVRISKTELRHKNELLIGRGRYRFEYPASLGDPTVDMPAQESPGTVNWQGGDIAALLPTFVELVKGHEPGQRFTLSNQEYWIGRDARHCQLQRANDNFTSPRHARIFRESKGSWHIESNKALNGVWLQVDKIQMTSSCQFQLGEQRFFLKVMS